MPTLLRSQKSLPKRKAPKMFLLAKPLRLRLSRMEKNAFRESLMILPDVKNQLKMKRNERKLHKKQLQKLKRNNNRN